MPAMSEAKKSAAGEGREGVVFFVSDAHFGAAGSEKERERVERFLRFLALARKEAGTLYIVGDLFDFWFEYSQVLPKTHTVIFTGLAGLVRSGVEVVYLAGNHDYWIGEFFSRTVGLRIRRESVILETQGRRLYVTHGDDLTAGRDPGYRFLRRLVRSSWAIRAYHWIHPDIGIPFARWASHRSRSYSNRKKFILNRTLESAILDKLREGFDGIVMGHIHVADRFTYEEGECLVLGDWMETFTYAVLREGKLELKRWED
ncbi:MAG: UDP-2,3-diacylglucosamine diphosphatase [Candidatus Eisenbacteria bacterium]